MRQQVTWRKSGRKYLEEILWGTGESRVVAEVRQTTDSPAVDK